MINQSILIKRLSRQLYTGATVFQTADNLLVFTVSPKESPYYNAMSSKYTANNNTLVSHCKQLDVKTYKYDKYAVINKSTDTASHNNIVC